jgi:uncharacterized OB-fold protein
MLNLLNALVFTWRAARENPRTPESFSDAEVRETELAAVRCPRCSGAVLALESRCPTCKSVAANFVVTSSGGGAIVLLATLTILGVGAYGWAMLAWVRR